MSTLKLCCISLVCILSSFAHGDELTLAVNDWCPYICDTSSKKPGILIEIVQDVFQEEGYKVKFKELPLNRAILEIKNNRIQGVIGIVPEILPDLVFPKEPAIKTQFCFFTLPQQKWEFENFEGYYSDVRVGVVSGKNINSKFDEVFPEKEAISGNRETAKRLVEMLVRQRVDTILEEKVTISYLLKQNQHLPRLRTAGCANKKDEYVAFSPADPHSKKYAELFSKGMLRLKKTGRIEEIFSSYVD